MTSYQIQQFHVHAPSEHTFNGKHYDVEFHFVHKEYDNEKRLAIAVYFDVEDGGDEPHEFIESLRFDEEDPTVPEIPIMQLINSLN